MMGTPRTDDACSYGRLRLRSLCLCVHMLFLAVFFFFILPQRKMDRILPCMLPTITIGVGRFQCFIPVTSGQLGLVYLPKSFAKFFRVSITSFFATHI
jgi:hypothetical protein